MKSIKIYSSLSLLLLISSCSNSESEAESEAKNERGCGSVDGCLSKYDFEGARYYYSAEVNYYGSDYKGSLKKITIAESKYWADKGEVDRALTVVDESWGIDDNDWPEADWQAWRYNIIDNGVTSCCEKGDYRQAKIYALKASNELNVDGFKIGSGTGRYLDRDGNEQENDYSTGSKEIKAKGPSMRESLLKKISQYEELVK